MKFIIYSIFFTLATYSYRAQSLSVELILNEQNCKAGEASIHIVSGLSPIAYEWSNGVSTSLIKDLEEGDYWVKVIDANNNDTTVYFHVQPLICEPIPESHFTPNNDAYNDTWNISYINNFPDFDLYVFNRWGQQIHHQTGIYIPWDGKSLSLPLPDATYYYILYLSRNDKNKFVKGAVSIIR